MSFLDKFIKDKMPKIEAGEEAKIFQDEHNTLVAEALSGILTLTNILKERLDKQHATNALLVELSKDMATTITALTADVASANTRIQLLEEVTANLKSEHEFRKSLLARLDPPSA